MDYDIRVMPFVNPVVWSSECRHPFGMYTCEFSSTMQFARVTHLWCRVDH